jgi:hypothetical protein
MAAVSLMPDGSEGAVDPETLYTKQNCIGMLQYTKECGIQEADCVSQVAAVLARSTKGKISKLS